MLVLTRKLKQSLRIGDDIVITVVSVQGDQVRLGITAPRDVQVLRQELYEEVSEANAQAARATTTLNVADLLSQLNLKGKEEVTNKLKNFKEISKKD